MQLWGAGKLTFGLCLGVVRVLPGIRAAGAAGGPAALVVLIIRGGLRRLAPFVAVVLWVPVVRVRIPLGGLRL